MHLTLNLPPCVSDACLSEPSQCLQLNAFPRQLIWLQRVKATHLTLPDSFPLFHLPRWLVQVRCSVSKSGASAGMDQGGSCLKMLEEVRVFWLRVQEAEAGEREDQQGGPVVLGQPRRWT